MKTEDIDEMLRKIRDYEHSSFGIKFGPDFPALAESLSTSKEFKGLCETQVAMAALMLLNIRGGGEKPTAESLFEKSPMREGLLIALYAGFKLGQRDAEIQKLEKEFSQLK